MCGSTEMDGHAFCLGLSRIQTPMHQVAVLIQGATLRPRHIQKKTGRLFSLGIASLAELLDMYHSHKATKPHDKVYGLLGMSLEFGSDSLTGLMPDYDLPWKTLMERLIHFLLSGQASIDSWNDRGMPAINIRGHVLGKVSSVTTTESFRLVSGQTVEAVFQMTSKESRRVEVSGTSWTLGVLSNPAQKGDLICLLQGSSKPAIVRLCEDFFVIVAIAVTPPKTLGFGEVSIDWSEFLQSQLFTRHFLLVWDWNVPLANWTQYGNSGNYEDWRWKFQNQPDLEVTVLESQVENALRNWNVAQILKDAEFVAEAEQKRRQATQVFEAVLRDGQLFERGHSRNGLYGYVPLVWASEFQNLALVDLILEISQGNPGWKDDVDEALWYAAGNGHEAITRLLIEKGEVDNVHPVVLWDAALNGHKASARQLLETGKIAGEGHNATVKAVLEMHRVDCGSEALLYAARNGHDAVVDLLLDTGKAENVDDALWDAAHSGHETLARRLLKTAKVKIDLRSYYTLTKATETGNAVMVRLLLEMTGVSPQRIDSALNLAVCKRHESVVRLLLETDKGSHNAYTEALSTAVYDGQEAIVRLLLETHKVDYGEGLRAAAVRGNLVITRMLLGTGEIRGRDINRALWYGARRGHENVARLLLETGMVDVEGKEFGRALREAAWCGQEAYVRLLLETDKVNVEAHDDALKAALKVATKGGHKSVAKLLSRSRVKSKLTRRTLAAIG
jgi:ankyrin repeat protein